MKKLNDIFCAENDDDGFKIGFTYSDMIIQLDENGQFKSLKELLNEMDNNSLIAIYNNMNYFTSQTSKDILAIIVLDRMDKGV